MYCSIKCKNKAHQSYDTQKERGIKRKLQLVKKFGGRCSICGYNKNLAGLTFHHTSEKKFKLDDEMLRPYFELSRVKKGIFCNENAFLE